MPAESGPAESDRAVLAPERPPAPPRQLFQLALSPFSRKVRLVLGEKTLPFELKTEKVWDRRPEFLTLNPAGQVPVLLEPGGLAIADSNAISEYLDEQVPAPPLLGGDPKRRAEVRRLCAWFDIKFEQEVSQNLLFEKLLKRFFSGGSPSAERIRAGKANIHYHLEYIGFLVERRKWLAGDDLSLADLAAAAHLSCLDYIDDVPWKDHRDAKEWYARVKSRPSFRPLLQDRIPGMPPPAHYTDLDF